MMLTKERRDECTKFIRNVQLRGTVFVCPGKDRALGFNEDACADCFCMDPADAPYDPLGRLTECTEALVKRLHDESAGWVPDDVAAVVCALSRMPRR